MRCRCCDAILTDYESTRKDVDTGQFLDICANCFRYIRESTNAIGNVQTMTLEDLMSELNIYPEGDTDYLLMDMDNITDEA